MLTGQHFWRLGAGANLWCEWPAADYPLYPNLLQTAGYHVGSFRKGWGPGKFISGPHNPAGKSYPKISAFFDARPAGTPFCLWFGSSDPHRPYERGSGKANEVDPSRVQLFSFYPDVAAIREDIADYYWEVQRFDRELGELLAVLEKSGELEHTIIIMTSDHGMPFPRCKGNLYDCGVRVPLAIRWGAKVKGNRQVNDLVSLTDLAPTLLAVAGLEVPHQMTGRSLLPILLGKDEGRVDPKRNEIFFGRERHTAGQAAPDRGGYPMRAIRTDDHLYIRNYRPDRWPAGTPNWQKAFVPGAWLADCDNGPTKNYLWDHRETPAVAEKYALCFAQRPAEELYDVRKDPDQLVNLAQRAELAETKRKLAERLLAELKKTNDPRISGGGDALEAHEYLGNGPRWSNRNQ